MATTLRHVVLLLTLGMSAGSGRQAERPCGGAEFRQFDFWLGDWDLSWPASPTSGGKPGRGTNRVEKTLDDCVILERFTGTPGMELRGLSVSTFSRGAGKWRQTWVDNTGAYLDFTGEFHDGRMVLERAQNLPDGKVVLQRMVWKNLRTDALDWSWERSEDGGRTWQVLWPIRYQRRKGSSPPAAGW